MGTGSIKTQFKCRGIAISFSQANALIRARGTSVMDREGGTTAPNLKHFACPKLSRHPPI